MRPEPQPILRVHSPRPGRLGIAATAATAASLTAAATPALARHLPAEAIDAMEAALHPERLAELAALLLPPTLLNGAGGLPGVSAVPAEQRVGPDLKLPPAQPRS